MRDIKNKLTSGKNTKNIQTRKGKSFGYQVLGFGAGGSASFVVATGGTITTSGDFKIHTFTGDATFTVSALASDPANDVVDYLVVAGGAGGGWANGGGGGGGAGGLRYSASTYSNPTPSGGNAGSALPVSVQGYPITVGGGGSYRSSTPEYERGHPGSNSVFSSITSAGGGGGGGGICGRR